MPAWLLSAMAMIRSGLFGGPGRALVTGGATIPALERITGIDIPFFGASPAALRGGRDGGGRRRRRRRALTASDRADIAFIVGIVGKAAGDRFAVQLATRSR